MGSLLRKNILDNLDLLKIIGFNLNVTYTDNNNILLLKCCNDLNSGSEYSFFINDKLLLYKKGNIEKYFILDGCLYNDIELSSWYFKKDGNIHDSTNNILVEIFKINMSLEQLMSENDELFNYYNWRSYNKIKSKKI